MAKKQQNQPQNETEHLDTASSQFVLFGKVATQTVHTAFIQALQVFCISTCPCLRVFTSEPLLHHGGVSIFDS